MKSMMLCVFLVFLQCAISGKRTRRAQPKYNNNPKGYEPNKWPTDKPTEDPTSDPTPYPTLAQCPSDILDPSEQSIEYILVVDNSCGLTKDECDVQKQEIADTFLQIKCDKEPYFTKVAYIEYYGYGANTLVGLTWDEYQEDIEKYYDFILDDKRCGKGGDDKSDAVAGLSDAIDEYLENGDDAQNTKRKIIMFNNCENTDYAYDEEQDFADFEDVVKQLKSTEFFTNSPDLMIINVPSQDKPAKNAISAPYDYLAFLIGEDSTKKPSPSQLYVAPAKFLNDEEITSMDYTKAAVIEDGNVADRADVYRNDDRLLQFVGVLNTEVPTAEPTEYPTTYPTENPTSFPTENPTENPTANPTEPKKACFKIDYFMKGKNGNSGKCMSSWKLYKKGTKQAVQSGAFKGYGGDKKCVYIEYPLCDYTLSIDRGCGNVAWYVDGEQCGQHDFDGHANSKKWVTPKYKSGGNAKTFPLRCSKSKKYSKW